MNSIIYKPLEEYEGKLKEANLSCVNAYFDNLVK